jgi:hypothetical protein
LILLFGVGRLTLWNEIFFTSTVTERADITQLTLTTALTFLPVNPSLKCGLGTEQGSAWPINVYDKREKGNEDESGLLPNV